MTETDDLAYWWLSFVDRTDDGTDSVACRLGVSIVTARGDSIVGAAKEAWANHCNPGGEVMGERLVDVPLHSLPRDLTYRLLTDPGDIAGAQIAIERAEGRYREGGGE